MVRGQRRRGRGQNRRAAEDRTGDWQVIAQDIDKGKNDMETADKRQLVA